jgi:allantoate deiminase
MEPTVDEGAAARQLMERIDILASLSEESGLLVRRSLTAQMTRANELVAAWMHEAGMTVRVDAVQNLIGRYEGTDPAAGTVILGSHLDSVRDAGRYDGPLGVLSGVACVEVLHRAGHRLPFAVEVIAFTDEEGLRFGISFLGSAAIAGTFDPTWLARQDSDGISVAEALRRAGGDPTVISACRYRATDVRGYCEVHIEQGPNLEAAGVPIGVVDAITGIHRATVSFTGVAGHAGTVPMSSRHDALAAAAEFIVAVERTAQDREGLVATVGQIRVQPGAGNVIAGQATVSLDLRFPDDTARAAIYHDLELQARSLAERRGVRVEWDLLSLLPATPCAPEIVEALAGAIADKGYPVQHLVSGAGHDGISMAHLTSVGMLFVRCKDGISHNPAESVREDDAAAAIAVLLRFLMRRAGQERSI